MTQKLLTFLFVSLFLLPAFAQISQIGHDVTIFSSDGLKFTVTFNGKKMNDVPSSNVVVSDINNDYVKALIEFEDSKIPTIKKEYLNIKSVSNKDNHPEEVVYEIKDKKGEYVLRWASASPKKIQQTNTIIIQQQPAPQPEPGVQISVPGVKVNVAVPKN